MKRNILFMLAGVLGLVLTGCGQNSLSPEKAAEVFSQAVVYQKDESQFKTTFKDANIWLEDSETDSFVEGFTEGFLQASPGLISKEQAAEFVPTLFEKMKKDTHISVASVQEENDVYTVTYDIQGLDAISVIKQTFAELLKATGEDPSIIFSQENATKFTTDAFLNNFKNISASNEVKQVKMQMKKEGSQYRVTSDQRTLLQELFSGVLLGEPKTEELNKQTETIVQEWSDEMTKQMEKIAESMLNEQQ